jgi:hypothetical protein
VFWWGWRAALRPGLQPSPSIAASSCAR